MKNIDMVNVIVWSGIALYVVVTFGLVLIGMATVINALT